VVLLYDVIEEFFVRFDILVALETTEPHMVDKKLGFDTKADKRKRYRKSVWSILRDEEMNVLLVQEVEKIQHSLQAVLLHVLLPLLSEARLIKELVAFVRSFIAALHELKQVGDRHIVELAGQLAIYRSCTIPRNELPYCKIPNGGR
jgi:hypothetical protein